MSEAVMQSGGAAAADSGAYGGFWIRSLAYAADMSILTLAAIALAVPFALLGGVGLAAWWILATVGPLAYFAWFTASARQATLGKQLCGLRVEHAASGERLSMLRSIWRELAKLLSAAVFFIGFLIAAFTRRKQGLHDMLAMTVVSRTGPARILIASLVALAGIVIPFIVIPLMFGALLAGFMGLLMGGMLGGAMQEHPSPRPGPMPRMERTAPRPQPVAPPRVAAPVPVAAPAPLSPSLPVSAPQAAAATPVPVAPAAAAPLPAAAKPPRAEATVRGDPPAAAVPAGPALRRENPPCVYKPVMTDEEIARCR